MYAEENTRRIFGFKIGKLIVLLCAWSKKESTFDLTRKCGRVRNSRNGNGSDIVDRVILVPLEAGT